MSLRDASTQELERQADTIAARVVASASASAEATAEDDDSNPAAARGALAIQRKCACSEDEDCGVQRQALPDAPAAEETGAAGPVLVDDDQQAGPEQARRSDFIQRLRVELFAAVERELAPTGRSAQVCPYIPRWIDYYSTRSAAQIERAVRRFAHPRGRGPDALIIAIVERVLSSVRIWLATGRVTGIPGQSEASGVPPRAEGSGAGAVQTQRAAGAPRVPNLRASEARASLGAGQPLGGALRRRLEGAFGSSLAAVRLHTDPSAERLSKRLAARAFTVGSDIAFGAGEFRPGTRDGELLLAHELVHTLQQSDGERLQRQHEDEAQGEEDDGALAASGGLLLFGCKCSGDTSPSPSPSSTTPTPNPPAPNPPKAHNRAGETLTDADRTAITQLTHATPPSGAQTFTQGPRFVLHDTGGTQAASSSGTAAARQTAHYEEMGRRTGNPIEESATAYINEAGTSTMARPAFFSTARRVTASTFEKAEDVPTPGAMSRADREAKFREVWAVTKQSERTAALDVAYSATAAQLHEFNRPGTNPRFPHGEITDSRSAAVRQLAAGSTEKVKTGATWAVQEICSRVHSAGAAAVAVNSAGETTLSRDCPILDGMFALRAQRMSSTANVEISQIRGGPCVPGPSDPAIPPYPAAVYNTTKLLYLRAAFEAGRFPEITTHYRLDSSIGSHIRCDPRCFRLDNLYASIQRALSDPVGTTYGIAATFGKPTSATAGWTDAVWWHDPVCGART